MRKYEKYFIAHLIFSVSDLSDLCIENCETANVECIVSCGTNLLCITDCVSDGTTCTQGRFSQIKKSFKIWFFFLKCVHPGLKFFLLSAIECFNNFLQESNEKMIYGQKNSKYNPFVRISKKIVLQSLRARIISPRGYIIWKKESTNFRVIS